MTNLVNVKHSKLFCGVSGINKVWFQEGSNSYISVSFSYAGGDASFEVYLKKSVCSSNKAPLLIEVNSLLNSIINNCEYMTIEKIEEQINNIEISDWARDVIS